MINKFIFLITSFASPLLLWPIEVYLPYPFIIEEVVKFTSLHWLEKTEFSQARSKQKEFSIYAFFFAVLFTLTESVLYLMNLSLLNKFSLFPTRLLYTGALHITTTLIISIAFKKKWYIKLLLLITAMIIHYFYNKEISNYIL